MNIQDRIKKSFSETTAVPLPSLTAKDEKEVFTLLMRPLSAGDVIKARKLGKDDEALRMAYMVIYSAVNNKDEKVYTSNDVDAIKDMRHEDLQSLVEAALYPGN